MNAKTSRCLMLIVLGLVPLQANADWTSFRNGGNSLTDKLPKSWSPESVAWQRELSGYGQSTPVISGSQVVVSSVVGQMKEKCMVECLDLASGEVIWSYGFKSAQQSPSNYMASRAAPTPVVDSRGIYVFFETGDLVAISHNGNKIWHRVLTSDYGKFENNHGLGSSPTQNETHLFLNVEHKGPSYLVSIKKSDGKTDWKVDRPSGSSWSSPIFTDSTNPQQVIVSSAGSVAGYDAADGQELWSVDGLDGNSVPSPTLSDGKLIVGARLPEFAAEGSIRSNCCLELATGTEEVPQVVWRADKAISDYASPVICGEFVYFINKVGVLHCLDANSGKLHFRNRLNSPCWATPVATNSHVYFFCKNGSTQVIEASDKFKVVADNALWDTNHPPKPESYVEYRPGSVQNGSTTGNQNRHANVSHPGQKSIGSESSAGNSSSSPGGGMVAALMRGDVDGDGVVGMDEIPADFRPMLPRIDTNGDGSLGRSEIEAMAKSFAERRANARAGSRDPIVYGVAASSNSIVIRTGTRLYCIRH